MIQISLWIELSWADKYRMPWIKQFAFKLCLCSNTVYFLLRKFTFRSFYPETSSTWHTAVKTRSTSQSLCTRSSTQLFDFQWEHSGLLSEPAHCYLWQNLNFVSINWFYSSQMNVSRKNTNNQNKKQGCLRQVHIQAHILNNGWVILTWKHGTNSYWSLSTTHCVSLYGEWDE